MNNKKSKSLGRMNHPKINVVSFNGNSGQFVLKLSDFNLDKYIRLDMSIYDIKQIIDTVHDLIEKYQNHIRFEQLFCTQLKDKTVYRKK